jgi:hypothetical protein
VIAAFVVETGRPIPVVTAPTTIVEGASSPAGKGRELIVHGAVACDLRGYGDPCVRAQLDAELRRYGSDVAARQLEGDLQVERVNAIGKRITAYMHAYLDGDESARSAAAAWPTEITVHEPAERAQQRARGWYELASLAVLLGGTDQGDNGFVFGIRPELVLARLKTESALNPGTGNGIGVYGELLSANHHSVVGGGLTFVPYLGGISLAPSVGVYHRATGEAPADSGVEVSVFLGHRHRAAELEYIDLPIGVRVDGHFGLRGAREQSVIVSAQFDLVGVALFAMLLSAIGHVN